MKKNARQIAFDAIREKGWSFKVNQRIAKNMSKILFALISFKKFKMLTKWKAACFDHVTSKRRVMEIDLFHFMKNDGFKRETKQNNQAAPGSQLGWF